MAASTKTTQAEKDDVDALFEGDATAAPEDDFDDLLDDVEEDDSEGWVPKEVGQGIVGIVVKVGTIKSDFAAEGQDPIVPVVTIECKDPDNPGQKIKWRVIGYSAVLKRRISEEDPQVGDRMAVKYFGEKKLKTGKYAGRPFKHFEIAVRHAPAVSA